MDIAVWLQHQPDYQSSKALTRLLEWIDGPSFGDAELSTELCDVANIAIREYHPDNQDDFRHDMKQRRVFSKIITRLDSIAKELIHRKRALRFFSSIQSIHQGQTACDHCDSENLPENAILSSGCGHLLCNPDCAQFPNGMCPVDGCNAEVAEHQIVDGARFASKHTHFHPNGEKLGQIARLITSEDFSNDQVLLFVQSDMIHEKVVEELQEHGITFTDLAKSKGLLSNALAEFTHGKGKKKVRTKVLILKIDDASASGSNLTMANRVIFVSPYYAVGSNAQQLYEAAMIQATGRAKRYGQTKKVHTYQFVTSGTIDVDILEKRLHKIVKYVQPKGPKVGKYVLVDPERCGQSEYGSGHANFLFEDEDEY